MVSINRIYNLSLQLLLAIFPHSTAWIYFDPVIDGVKWQYGTLLWYASEAVLAVCVMSCCLFLYTHHIRGKQIQFHWTKERLFVLSLAGFCAYLYGRSFFTLYPDIALQQSVHVLEAILFFFCILFSPVENKALVRAVVLGAVLQAILGLSQFFLQTTWNSTLLGTSAHLAAEAGSSVVVTEGERWLRAYGTFAHPNIFGGYLALVLVLFLYSFQSPVSKQISNFKFQISNSVLVVVLTAGIFVSFSRSAWIALFLGVLILSFRLKRPEGVKWRNPFLTPLSQNEVKSSILTSKGSFAIAQDDKDVTSYMLYATCFITFTTLSILFYPLITTRLGATSVNEQQSIHERVSGNSEAFELVQDNTMFGVGPGHYTVTLMQKDPSRPVWEYQPVHNVLLLVLAEIGIVGVLFFVFCSLLFIITFRLPFVDGLWFAPFIPLLLFDHYMWSSLVGLFIVVIYAGFYMRLRKEVVKEN